MVKRRLLLSFRLNDMNVIEGGPGGAPWWDKVPSKFAGWGEAEFRAAGFRAVPGCIVRHSAIRAGRRADAELRQSGRPCRHGTMVDKWATVGSCAQIGKNVF